MFMMIVTILSSVYFIFCLLFNIYLLSKAIAEKTMLLNLLNKEIDLYKNNYETLELLVNDFDSYLYISGLIINTIF